MKSRFKLQHLGLFAFLLAMYSCGKTTQQQRSNQPLSLKVVTVTTSDVTLHEDFPTTLQGQQTVEIRPRIAGYIEEMLVDEGDFVKKGQTLFRLNSNDILAQVRSAEAQVKVADAQVATAKINVDKTEPLVEKDIVSEFELESQKTNLALAEAQLAQAKANLANAKANLSYAVITSPTDGIIGNFPYRVGSLVSSTITTPLTTVSNTQNMQAYFSMNDKQFLSLTKDLEGATIKEKLVQLPEVSLVLSDNSVYDLKGKIETASGIVDQQTGSINIRASFPNPNGVLRSGSSGRVRLPELYKDQLTVPQSATYEIQGTHFVFVVNSENKVVNTAIEIIAGNLKDIYVVKHGLKAGDKIVVEGISKLKDGMQINPQE